MPSTGSWMSPLAKTTAGYAQGTPRRTWPSYDIWCAISSNANKVSLAAVSKASASKRDGIKTTCSNPRYRLDALALEQNLLFDAPGHDKISQPRLHYSGRMLMASPY